MMGQSLVEQGIREEVIPNYYSVKEAVFPFIKFSGVDPILGPEMKSTGEVMGTGRCFGEAFYKALLAAGVTLPYAGKVFISVRDADKQRIVPIAQELAKLGFELLATRGTKAVLAQAGIACAGVNKVLEGRPHIVDMIKNDEIVLIINTTEGRKAVADSYAIRRSAIQHKVTYTTTLAGAWATCEALSVRPIGAVYRLQDLHREART
jgi:carbamoyl-phosphate synthase large subunit